MSFRRKSWKEWKIPATIMDMIMRIMTRKTVTMQIMTTIRRTMQIMTTIWRTMTMPTRSSMTSISGRLR